MNNYYTEQELTYAIEYATGLKIGDYGFIDGTHSAYLKAGLTTSSMVYGYTIWKKNKDGTVSQKDVSPKEHSLDIILKFLKDGN